MLVIRLASVMSRQLSPTPFAQELLHRAESTPWYRQLQAASEFLSQRRQRKRQRKLRRRENETNQPHERNLEYNTGNKYNDYLPEDTPGPLLGLDDVAHEETTCLSPLQKWFVSLIESIGIGTWEEINDYNITSLAYLFKHHVSNSDGTNEYFGTYGDRTYEMKRNHETLATFWSTNPSWASSSRNVLLMGMHGGDLAEDTFLVATLQQMYSMDGNEAYAAAAKIQSIIATLPGSFNNPVLTANAIAIQSLNPDGSKSERDSIIIGDGVFIFLEWLGLSKDGPYYIHSHEFGHHLQYDLGVDKIGNGWTAGEETRR